MLCEVKEGGMRHYGTVHFYNMADVMVQILE